MSFNDISVYLVLQCPIHQKFVELEDGNKIWTIIANKDINNDKPPLVLLHGFGGGVGLWVSSSFIMFIDGESTRFLDNHCFLDIQQLYPSHHCCTKD